MTNKKLQPRAEYFLLINRKCNRHFLSTQFLARMLDDRAGSVRDVREIGAELTRGADEAERQQVDAQLMDLVARWEKLSEFSEKRQQDLDNMLHVSIIVLFKGIWSVNSRIALVSNSLILSFIEKNGRGHFIK